jgi:hypothetical protein
MSPSKASPAPAVESPRVVPTPSPTVVGIVPSPTSVPKPWIVPTPAPASPGPAVVINIDGQVLGVVSPARIAIIGVVIGKIIGLFPVRNGVILILAGVAFNIGENLVIKNFSIFIGLITKIVTIKVAFLFFELNGLCGFFLHMDHSIATGVDAIIII